MRWYPGQCSLTERVNVATFHTSSSVECSGSHNLLTTRGGREVAVNAYYIVVCKTEENTYTLATHTAWRTRKLAEEYAMSLPVKLYPIVIKCPVGVEFQIGDYR